jgi:hypothetical protein
VSTMRLARTTVTASKTRITGKCVALNVIPGF